MTVGHIFRNFSVILHPFLIKVKKKKDKIMLQRDYIQRLIREFMAALERMLERQIPWDSPQEMNS